MVSLRIQDEDFHSFRRENSALSNSKISQRNSITTVLSKMPNKSNSNINTIITNLPIQEIPVNSINRMWSPKD